MHSDVFESGSSGEVLSVVDVHLRWMIVAASEMKALKLRSVLMRA
jgi:hypothetical protein